MILIFSPYGRCGSTSLCRYLGLSFGLKYILEPYNPSTNYYQDLENLKNCISHKKEDVKNKEILNFLLANYELVKILNWPLDFEFNKHIISVSEKIVFLYRENKLEQILSKYLSLSFKKSHVWHKGDIEYNGNEFFKLTREPINFEHFNFLYNDARLSTLNYKNLILDCYKDKSIIVTYEDLFHEKQKVIISKIIDFLEFKVCNNDHEHLLSKDNKLNNPNSYKLIPNIEDVIRWYNELEEIQNAKHNSTNK